MIIFTTTASFKTGKGLPENNLKYHKNLDEYFTISRLIDLIEL